MGINSIDAEDDQFAYRYDTQLLIDRRDQDRDEVGAVLGLFIFGGGLVVVEIHGKRRLAVDRVERAELTHIELVQILDEILAEVDAGELGNELQKTRHGQVGEIQTRQVVDPDRDDHQPGCHGTENAREIQPALVDLVTSLHGAR